MRRGHAIHYNAPEAIKFVSERVGGSFTKPRCVSVHDGDRVLGAVVFEAITGTSCYAHVAARPGTTWASRTFLQAVTDYVFRILRLEHVYSIAPENNRAAIRFNERMGMRPLTHMPGKFPDSDGVLFHVEPAIATFLTDATIFKLELDPLTVGDNEKQTFLYDLDRGLLFDEFGDRVSPFGTPLPFTPQQYPAANAFSPSAPAKKRRKVERLKIQLGLGCNYSCSYCMQGSHKQESALTSTRDVDAFLHMLGRYLDPDIKRFELWGGEPLVYWTKLKRLIPALREQFPTALIGMVTNGSLLTEEKAEFLCHYDVNVSMSHDGPAHTKTRGDDPLDNPEVVKAVRKLHGDHRLYFISVLTEEMTSITAVKEYIAGKVGFEPRVGKEGIVRNYNGEPAMSPEALSRVHVSTVMDGLRGELDEVSVVDNRLSNFYQSIHAGIPKSAFGQSCAMDREDWLAVDLLGNVITCQNVGAESKHKLGHISDMDSVQLDTGWHWLHRPECSQCPVLVLCRGSCLYLDEEAFKTTCEHEKAYNKALMTLAFFKFTGKLLSSIERV